MKKIILILMILLISLYFFLIKTTYLSDYYFNLGYEAYQKSKIEFGSRQQENIKIADKYLGRSLELDPNNYKKNYTYADNLYTIFSDLDPNHLKAREIFKKAFAINSKSDTLAFIIGWSYLNGVLEEYQNIDSSLKYINFAIDLNKDYYDAVNARAIIYQTKLFKYTEAIRDLKHLISLYETNKTDPDTRWQFPKQTLYDRLNYCYQDLKAINNKKNESTNIYIPECSDMDSYNLGYLYAADQLGGGLLADCDYLYQIAVTQREHVDHYCFCKGINKWLNDHNRSN